MKLSGVDIKTKHKYQDGTLLLRCMMCTKDKCIAKDVKVQDDVIPITTGIEMTLAAINDEIRAEEEGEGEGEGEGGTNESV